MKKLMLMASCALLLMAAGCKKSSSNEPVEPKPDVPTATVLAGEVARPSWTKPEDHDMSSSMTAIVKVDLTQTYPDAVDAKGDTITADIVAENDLLAAFAGDVCVGAVDTLVDGLFYLYVTAPASQNESEESSTLITLRYYSSELKNLFEAKEAFVFQNDGSIGTGTEPFAPEFTLVEK